MIVKIGLLKYLILVCIENVVVLGSSTANKATTRHHQSSHQNTFASSDYENGGNSKPSDRELEDRYRRLSETLNQLTRGDHDHPDGESDDDPFVDQPGRDFDLHQHHQHHSRRTLINVDPNNDQVAGSGLGPLNGGGNSLMTDDSDYQSMLNGAGDQDQFYAGSGNHNIALDPFVDPGSVDITGGVSKSLQGYITNSTSITSPPSHSTTKRPIVIQSRDLMTSPLVPAPTRDTGQQDDVDPVMVDPLTVGRTVAKKANQTVRHHLITVTSRSLEGATKSPKGNGALSSLQISIVLLMVTFLSTLHYCIRF